MHEEIRSKLRRILAEQLGLEESHIDDDARFLDDLNIDSLDVVELVMKIEDEFGFSIPDQDAENIQTVRDAIAYLLRRDDEQGSASVPAKPRPKPNPPSAHRSSDE